MGSRNRNPSCDRLKNTMRIEIRRFLLARFVFSPKRLPKQLRNIQSKFIQKSIQICIFFCIALPLGLLVGFPNLQFFASAQAISSPKFHPLPQTLAQWQDRTNSGDYFNQIQTNKFGHLIWSTFPVRVYIETPTNINPDQANIWVKTVTQSVTEWNQYLPLQLIPTLATADIIIQRKVPPLQGKPPRARSALATYELYTKDQILRHQFTILLAPSQTGKFLLSAARHELGHALGIWGHSTNPTDVLYFSQVANPPTISPRDINTLKRIYQQPTSLGWKLETGNS